VIFKQDPLPQQRVFLFLKNASKSMEFFSSMRYNYAWRIFLL